MGQCSLNRYFMVNSPDNFRLILGQCSFKRWLFVSKIFHDNFRLFLGKYSLERYFMINFHDNYRRSVVCLYVLCILERYFME